MSRDRDAQQQQHVEQVVARCRRPASRAGAPGRRRGSAPGSARRSRRRCRRPSQGQRVGDRLAGQRAAEDQPVAVRPRREHQRARRPRPRRSAGSVHRAIGPEAVPATMTHVTASQTASFRVSAASPSTHARGPRGGGPDRALDRGPGDDPGHEEARRRAPAPRTAWSSPARPSGARAAGRPRR